MTNDPGAGPGRAGTPAAASPGAAPSDAPDSGARQPAPHIGAFVLETLTLGMYGEPRHTLREYVQNAFDSIRAAQRAKRLAGRGRVDVTLGGDAITIKDNGLGVRANVAWATLLSVGASKKNRQRDVGFRGIGRLAGMAYCETLTFRTTFPGETVLTTITFDCRALLKAMNPDEGGDVGLATLLAQSTRFVQEPQGAAADEHFFEVTLRGLAAAGAPDVLREPGAVRTYLSETVPVPFADGWKRRAEIEARYQRYFGAPLETIDVYVHADGGTKQIFKPYGDIYRIGKTETPLESVQFIEDADDRYWGWVGHLSGSAAVTDPRTAGLRVRVRNIQVDGTGIMAGIFAEAGASYQRLAMWYVGEIYVAPDQVLPNARRDGFEETAEWLAIKHSLRDQWCAPLAREAHRKSRMRQLDVNKLVSGIQATVERSRVLADDPQATYDQVVELMNSAKSQRRKAAAALKLADDPEDVEAAQDDADEADGTGASPTPPTSQKLREAAQDVEAAETTARMLVGRFVGNDVRTESVRDQIRREVVQEVLDVVSAYVDQAAYQEIRRQLTRRA